MYIGQTPSTGAYKLCDAITTSSTATYNLTVGSVATSPETANHCIVSLNGVIQAPSASGGFTISGSQIVFTSSLTSADVVDFILILGDVMSIGTPSDDTVTLAKMASGTDGNIISYDASGNPVAIATGSDGQVLTSTGAGSPPAFETLSATNTPAFEAHRTARQVVSDNTFTKLAAGTEVFDTDGTYDHATNSRFTPAVVGKYFIYASIGLGANDNDALATGAIAIYKNGSVYQTHHNDNSNNFPNGHWVHIYSIMDLDADDYVEIFGRVNTTASSPFFEGIASNTYQSTFGGFKIIT